jgi:heat shock protein HslJ
MFHAKAKAVVYTGLVLLQFEMFSNITQGKPGKVDIVAGPVSQAVMLAQSEGLENTHWTLVELNGQPVEAGSTDKEAYFELDPKGKTLQGLTGCNRMSGGYETRGDALQFSKVVMTRMACVKGMEIEAAFSKALTATTKFKLN